MPTHTFEDRAAVRTAARSAVRSAVRPAAVPASAVRPAAASAVSAVAVPAGAEPSWQESALCAQTGPELFFPEPGSSTREAKFLCGLCEIREACLEYALTHDERFGVWGGLSEQERYELRRRRSSSAA
ncbi:MULTISPECIES: WhiB family transcriptional regulator [Streptomyces]|uniref:Transcriptional regulator WhiB n=3 Tax=Streptomyces TaxID=1883 RepID=A0A1D8G9I5_9ACTN|nr:Transcriptional regulator WhiB2 [Streptomyces rubrolavendulae]OSY51525.1 Transcriptional regulator WhiB2 [Streptomyces fradiae ATCC 10745 = DSM 40063]